MKLFKSKPKFILQRFREKVSVPIESEWSIRILNVQEPLEACKILVDEKAMPWWDKETCYYERSIIKFAGAIVRVDKKLNITDESVVKIMNRDEVIRIAKWKDIILVEP
jgi:hypothetical protein